MAGRVFMTEAEIRAMLAPKPKVPKVYQPKVIEVGYPCLTPVTLTLPWCPLNNRTWRHVGSRPLLSEAAREYRKAVWLAVIEQWPQDVLRPLNSRLACTIVAHAPDKRRYDIDGTCKQIWDSLQKAGVFLDDWQFDALHILRGLPKKGGEIVVTIGPNEQ